VLQCGAPLNIPVDGSAPVPADGVAPQGEPPPPPVDPNVPPAA